MAKNFRVVQFAITIIGIFLLPSHIRANYISNAFALKNSTNESILTNRDLSCVQLDEKSRTANFGLSEGARRFFYKYTKENAKTDLITEICGRQISKSTIMQPISEGVLIVGNLKEAELTCLREAFDVSESCQDCPVCKKYGGTETRNAGFKVSAMEPDSIYKMIGLQTGDRVIAINGEHLKSTEAVVEMLNKLKGSRKFRIDFVRDGQHRTLTYSFDEK